MISRARSFIYNKINLYPYHDDRDLIIYSGFYKKFRETNSAPYRNDFTLNLILVFILNLNCITGL